MNIDPKKVTVRDLADGYRDDGDGGVTGYGGKLDIRPAYQREFVYEGKQRDAVIETINKGFPLNVMYWAVRDDDGTYEIIDGQQRTISICQYVKSVYAVDDLYFHNLQDNEQKRILDYELQVYFCEGTDSEKLGWFEIVNIAGEELTKQELRNAVYAGPWLADAKKRFSRPNGPAHGVAGKYLNRKAIRQEYLETAIKWAKKDGQTIEEYMGAQQKKKTARALWKRFRTVIDRVEAVFPTYRKIMKGIDWGGLYKHMESEDIDPEKMEADVARLMKDDEVEGKKGIYAYLLTGEEKHLSLRAFGDTMKIEAYEKQEGKCNNPKCPDSGKEFEIDEMEADHIDPWSKGGKTVSENCQVLCKPCNRRKSDK